MGDLYENPFAEDSIVPSRKPATQYEYPPDDYAQNYVNYSEESESSYPQEYEPNYEQDHTQDHAAHHGDHSQIYQQDYQQNYQQEENHAQVDSQNEQSDAMDQSSAPFDQRRDSLAIRLSKNSEASRAAFEAFPNLKSFSQEESPYSEIQVIDPEKLSDHTVYKVVVKSKDGNQCYVQQRRYQHFEWLATELVNKYPGVIVPPIPEKRVLGRFNAEFIEARRYFLEVFLKKINKHPILMGSEDFRTFVESNRGEEMLKKESKGIMQLVGGVFSESVSFGKSHPDDKWYEGKKTEVNKLDSQLKKLQRKVEVIVKQRKDLGSAVASFWNDISSNQEDSDIFHNLSQLGAIQLKVEEIHQRESSQYVVNFGYTVEESIRMLDSVRVALNARATCCRLFYLAEDKLQKKKERLDKLMGQADKNDLVTLAVQEVEQAQKECDVSKKNFEEIDKIAQAEMVRFDREMNEDFKESMKNYVVKMVEAQSEISKWWNDYLPQVETLN